jgi:hypothetical protein
LTITVVDTQPPSITCTPNVTAVAAPQGGTGAVVNYAAPTSSDNCPGVTSQCVPPSGSTFPVGTTTVTCTATDASGNLASCSFTVTVFSVFLQDDSVPGKILLWNALTGDYRLRCNGTEFTGRGQVQKIGNILTLTHNPPDRRLQASIDLSVKRGLATLKSPPSQVFCTITDRNTSNNVLPAGI